MNITHSGFIAIVGRPNVGKSTLLNALIGQKISITSRKAQTTRHRITGVLTEAPHQAVFVDTPGLHSEERRAINRLMNRAAESAIGDVELVLFVLEGTHWTDEDARVLDKIRRSAKVPVIAVINKVDLVKPKEQLLPHLQWLQAEYPFAEIMPLCAESGEGVERLKNRVFAALAEGPELFPEEYVTDRSQRFLAAEIVREKLMRFLGEELPYSVTVEIEKFEYDRPQHAIINALILVEREGQKKMVIGKGGEKLKTIGREARLDIGRMLGHSVHLELWVKVKSGWADDERALRSLGYSEE